MRKVLVTGADGFIGSHLTERLVQEGFDVRALCLYNSFNSWGWLDSSEVRNQVEIVTGDVRDAHFCMDLLKGIDTVFHLAALIAIPYSYVAPASYVDTNINGTINICKAAHAHGVKRLIHTSTSEVYGTALYVPIDEKHPLQPQSPYSASKIGADAMAMSFFHAFELPVTVARPFNTYGPRQSARAVIPTLISQIASGRKAIQIGDTSPTRDFNYVEDTCRGFLALAECDSAVGVTVNIGSNYEVSIRDTFELITKLMGVDVDLVEDSSRIRPKGSEVHRLWCDNRLIEKMTGFKPQVSLEQGLRRSIEWFTNEDNLKLYKVDFYNI
jgi:NAD dependent epimerase/dehydratase